jgi:hypothetical protein
MGYSESPTPKKATATWASKKNSHLLIDVSNILTPEQKAIINSGFTTFTQLRIQNHDDQYYTTACSIKYDTWEERYEITKINSAPKSTQFVKTLADWSKDCLSIQLKVDHLVNRRQILTGTLYIQQGDEQESKRIKEWLVKQQSGFMQGLYSHMLGTLTFQNQVDIIIEIPTDLPNDAKESDGQSP